MVDRNSGSSKKRLKISPSGIVGEALGFGVGFPGFQNLLDLGTREDVHHTGLLAMLRARVPQGHVRASLSGRSSLASVRQREVCLPLSPCPGLPFHGVGGSALS